MTTKQRHVAFGLAFAVAAGILLTDRLFVLPKRAGAESSASSEANAALVLDAGAVSAVASKTRRVADRLARLCPKARVEGAALRNAFALPAGWQALMDPNGELVGPDARAATFRQGHQLLAVADGGGAACAFVGSRRLRIGDVLDGFTLVAADSVSATFEADGMRVVLRLGEGR